MSQTVTPTLSPAFERARKLSRVMAVLFTIAFWLTLLGTIVVLGIPFVPVGPVGQHGPSIVGLNDINVPLNGLSLVQRLWVTLAIEIATVPVLLLMHHTRRVFGHFARGEIFALPVIGHIRRAGVWLIVCFFAEIAGPVLLTVVGLIPSAQRHNTAWPLVIGIVTVIAAYVMAEASRIAAEHAEII